MKQLDLSDKQRESIFVTYDQKKYCLYCKEPFGIYFLAAYTDYLDMVADFDFNGISPRFDHGATIQSLIDSRVL